MIDEKRLEKLENQIEFIIAAVFGGAESAYAPLYKSIVGEELKTHTYPKLVIEDDVQV